MYPPFHNSAAFLFLWRNEGPKVLRCLTNPSSLSLFPAAESRVARDSGREAGAEHNGGREARVPRRSWGRPTEESRSRCGIGVASREVRRRRRAEAHVE
jgi:hypothetical protein